MRAKHRPSLFVKANTWLYSTLSSPWKIALDQSMTFHKVLPEQNLTLEIVQILFYSIQCFSSGYTPKVVNGALRVNS